MQEFEVHFRERLVSVQLADPNEVLPELSVDVVATIPPEPGSQNDAAGQLAALSTSLDDLRRQLTTQTSPSDESADAGEATAAEAAAANKSDAAPASDVEAGTPA